MKIGIEAAFSRVNESGGVNGRLLRLISSDDGYEPSRTLLAVRHLVDEEKVFGFIGNVGTPTTVAALPYVMDHRMLFFGAFTGSNILRQSYRAAAKFIERTRDAHPDMIYTN